MINSSKIGYQLNRYVDNKYVEKSFIFSNIIEQNYINDIENNVIIYVGRINKNIKRTNLLLEAIKNTNSNLDYRQAGIQNNESDKTPSPIRRGLV